jgi:Ran GTPase-activating protein (RanGAP) involved in mRNA processing and transport
VDIDAHHMQKCSFMPHHNRMMTKWKCALAGFEKNKSGKKVTKLRIKRVELVKDVMDFLGNALVARNSIVHLALVNNKLDREGYLSLSAFLKKNSSPLKTLQLEGNPIYDVACAQCLSEAVISHPSLDELKVEDCGLGRNTEILSAISNTMKGVSLLSLNSNDIENSGAVVICNVLSTNPSHLTKLMVTSNEINDEGATLFAEALRTNTSLKDLFLRGNDISKAGEIALRKTVFNDTTLITLFNSNHTCKIQGLGIISSENSSNFKNTIKRKMSTAMFGCFTHGKDSKVTDTRTIAMNMHLFADCPVELMPVELSFINRCSNFNDTKKPCLSNMYEVVRNWDVPVMFAYAVGAVAPPEKKRRRKRGGRTNITAKKAKTC